MKQSCDKLRVKFKQRVDVVSRITNSCVEQAVIAIISVVSLSVNSGTEVGKQ